MRPSRSPGCARRGYDAAAGATGKRWSRERGAGHGRAARAGRGQGSAPPGSRSIQHLRRRIPGRPGRIRCVRGPRSGRRTACANVAGIDSESPRWRRLRHPRERSLMGATPGRTGVLAEAVGHVSLATAARSVVRPAFGYGSPVGLGIAQAILAAVLALAASSFEARGWGEAFILGAASVVLVVSGLLLVVWSDPDDGANVGSGHEEANRGQTTA